MDNYMNSAINRGSCGELRGKTLMLFVFVNNPGNRWTDREKEAERKTRIEILRYLKREAAAEGIVLRFFASEFSLTVPFRIDHNVYANVHEAFLRQMQCIDGRQLAGLLLKTKNADQLAIVYLIRQEGRGFARPVSHHMQWDSEYLFVFGLCHHHLLHELLHLFGAMDLYYPQRVRDEAQRLFPNSVMLSGESWGVDDLTRYLIGWRKTMTPAALQLYSLARGVGIQEYNSFIQNEWSKTDSARSQAAAGTRAGSGTRVRRKKF